jgi:hypothetical protein
MDGRSNSGTIVDVDAMLVGTPLRSNAMVAVCVACVALVRATLYLVQSSFDQPQAVIAAFAGHLVIVEHSTCYRPLVTIEGPLASVRCGPSWIPGKRWTDRGDAILLGHYLFVTCI